MKPEKKDELGEEEVDVDLKSLREYRRRCMDNNFDYIEKMVHDELKEIRTYKLFEEAFDYKNPFACDESTSIKDDVKTINEK